MRVVEEIPHPVFKITVFAWNAKYLVKVEHGGFEQVFKIGESDVTGLGDIRKMVTSGFLENAARRFAEMSQDWAQAYRSL